MPRRAPVILISLLLVAACGGSAGDTGAAPGSTSTTVPPVPTAPATTAPSPIPPPHLDVEFPTAGLHLAAGTVLFTGSTDPGCSVTVGGTPAVVDGNGRWQAEVSLPPGTAMTSVVATDQGRRRTELQVALGVEATPGVVGARLDAAWVDAGYVREYVSDSGATGYQAYPELPITWTGDYVTTHLGFAEPVGALARRPRTMVGLLLDSSDNPGGELLLVLDAVAVPFDPMAGTVASLWPIDRSGPYLLKLRYTKRGPVVERAWLVAVERDRFVEIPPDLVPYPDLSDRPVENDGTGMIVGRAGRWYTGGNPPYDPADLSGPVPRVLDLFDHGGFVISGEGQRDAAFSLFTVDRDSPAAAHQAWLEEMVARDYTGSPIWHATAVLTLPPLMEGEQPSIWCHTPEGLPVAAVVTPGESGGLVAVRAWELHATERSFVEVDASTVECPIEGD